MCLNPVGARQRKYWALLNTVTLRLEVTYSVLNKRNPFP